MHQIGHIHVISCGIGTRTGTHMDVQLPESLWQYIKNAEHIFASKALLSRYAQHENSAQQHPITAKAKDDAKHALALCAQGKQVVVLASGDALYNGMGGTLLSLRQYEALTFHPHITAFQALFHTLALPWGGVALFSVHAPERIPVRRIASEPFSLTYGGTKFPASHVAKALMDFMPEAKDTLAVLAERLGSEQESIRIDTLASLAQMPCHATSILLVVPPSHQRLLQDSPFWQTAPSAFHEPKGPILPLGLPEAHYERENNLITASDVRAIILSRLRLPAWGTLWDMGAGSGSVGLEAAGLCPHLNVLALEQKEHRLAHIYANQKRMGVSNYHALQGNALDFLHSFSQNNAKSIAHKHALPHEAYAQPDRIFIGGGGVDIAQIITQSLALLPPDGLLVVSAVTLESFHSIAQCAQEHRVSLSSIQIAHEHSIAREYHTLKNQNTIYLFTFCPKKP